MANEVSVNISLAISKLGVTNILSKSYTRDLAGTNQLSNVQTIGTSAELLSIVDLANVAHLCVMNVGGFPVQLSLDSGGAQVFAELQAGDICYVPQSSGVTQRYAKAIGGNSDLAVLSCES